MVVCCLLLEVGKENTITKSKEIWPHFSKKGAKFSKIVFLVQK